MLCRLQLGTVGRLEHELYAVGHGEVLGSMPAGVVELEHDAPPGHLRCGLDLEPAAARKPRALLATAHYEARAVLLERLLVRRRVLLVDRGSVHGSLKDRHDSYETALACYNSPEYQNAAKFRDQGGQVDVIVIEGYEPAT